MNKDKWDIVEEALRDGCHFGGKALFERLLKYVTSANRKCVTLKIPRATWDGLEQEYDDCGE